MGGVSKSSGKSRQSKRTKMDSFERQEREEYFRRVRILLIACVGVVVLSSAFLALWKKFPDQSRLPAHAQPSAQE